MNPAVVILLAVGLVQGHVIPAGHLTSSQYHAQDELGQYTYGYAGGPSAKHEERTADGITRGGYSYLDSNGLIQSTSYVSDPINGFRVASTNLPAAPAPILAPASIIAAAPAPILAAAPAPILAAAPAILPSHEIVAAGPALIPASPEAPVAEVAAEAPVEEGPEAPVAAPVVESDDTAVIESADAEPEIAVKEAVEAAPEAVVLNPVEETPEVAGARAAHLAAVEETKSRDAAVAARDALLATAPRIIPVGSAIVGPAPIAYSAPIAVAPAPVAIASAPITRVAVAAAPAPIARVAVAAAPAPVAVAPAHIAVAASEPIARVAVAAAPAFVGHVASQYHAQDELGQYTYGYAGGPSAKAETKTFDGITRGGYSYIDANGVVQSASYVSDPINGFRVAATNIPVQPEPAYIPDSPEVAEAKEKLFKAQAEHIAKL